MVAQEFRVTFHGPFRVGTGIGRSGVDQVAHRWDLVDRVQIAPASTVKGVMRAAAAELLAASVVDEVFGGRGRQCSWSWSGLTVPAPAVHSRTRTRIEVAPDTGTVAEDMLAVAEELVVTGTGVVTVHRLGFAPASAQAQPRHLAVLRVAAGLVTGAGGTRRRGLGWISLTPAGADPATRARADLDLLADGGWL